VSFEAVTAVSTVVNSLLDIRHVVWSKFVDKFLPDMTSHPCEFGFRYTYSRLHDVTPRYFRTPYSSTRHEVTTQVQMHFQSRSDGIPNFIQSGPEMSNLRLEILTTSVSMSVTAPIFTKCSLVRQLHAKNSFMEFHENSIKRLVADTRPKVESRRTFGVSAQDTVFLRRKERLITIISLDEIKKQFLSLLVAQPVANHSTVLLLYR